jgi:hypothetical protein
MHFIARARYLRSLRTWAPSCGDLRLVFWPRHLVLSGSFLRECSFSWGHCRFGTCCVSARVLRLSCAGSMPPCVVGLLGAAPYNFLWTGSVKSSDDVAVVLVGFILLVVWRAPPVLVVLLGALTGIGLMLST